MSRIAVIRPVEILSQPLSPTTAQIYDFFIPLILSILIGCYLLYLGYKAYQQLTTQRVLQIIISLIAISLTISMIPSQLTNTTVHPQDFDIDEHGPSVRLHAGESITSNTYTIDCAGFCSGENPPLQLTNNTLTARQTTFFFIHTTNNVAMIANNLAKPQPITYE